jgi:hypothetical protein
VFLVQKGVIRTADNQLLQAVKVVMLEFRDEILIIIAIKW